jgi:hypothetical protein
VNVLRTKHWQVFLLAWGPHAFSILQLIFAPKTIGDNFLLWFLLLIVGTTNSFIWAWRVMVEMKRMYPTNILAFKIAYWIPAISILVFIAELTYNFLIHKRAPSKINSLMVWATIGILSLVCIAFGLLFIGRMLKAVELKRTPTVREHLFESIVMLVPPIGVWIVQPRLNEIYANQKA